MEPLIPESPEVPIPSDQTAPEVAAEGAEAEPDAEVLPVGEAAHGKVPAPPDWLAEALAGLEERLCRGLALVRKDLEDRLALDRFKEAQIERLHQELQAYKQDLFARINRPLLMGLIRLHNDLGRAVAALHDRPAEEQTPGRFFGAFEGFHDDLELLLEQHGVERFEAAEPVFDPSRQTALRTLETEEVGQVGRIAQRVRPGFSLGTTLLQREGVAVYARANREDAEAPPVPEIDEPNPGGDLE